MSECSPSNEGPELQQNEPCGWVVLAVFVVGHAVLGAMLNQTPHYGESASVGFLFSQPLLFAFWAAFAPQRLHTRFLWGLLLCVVVACVAEAGAWITAHRYNSFSFGAYTRLGFYLSMDLILFLVAVVLLLCVKRVSRCQLVKTGATSAPVSYRAHQFGIGHLLVLTTITAVVCGTYRSLTQADSSISVRPIGEVVEITFQVLALFSPITVVPWFTLGGRKHNFWAAFCVPSLLELAILGYCCVRLGFQQVPVEVTIFLLSILSAQFAGAASVFVSTLVLRACGYRMIRLPKPPAAVPVS